MSKLGWHGERVDRLFRLDQNSRLDQLGQAFKAIDVPLLRHAIPHGARRLAVTQRTFNNPERRPGVADPKRVADLDPSSEHDLPPGFNAPEHPLAGQCAPR